MNSPLLSKSVVEAVLCERVGDCKLTSQMSSAGLDSGGLVHGIASMINGTTFKFDSRHILMTSNISNKTTTA